jgi:uncharacterized protein (TIGR03435 family)
MSENRGGRWRLVGGLLCFVVVMACGFAVAGNAQLLHPNGARPSFAVASVRPSAPDGVEFERAVVQGGGFTGRSMTLRQIVSFAYGITFARELVGGPVWAGTDKFDIEAKADDAALSKLSRDDLDERVRLMLQSLLAERFKLKVSFAKKELPIFVLTVAKGGMKCPKVAAETPLAKMAPPRFAWTALPPPPPPPPGYTPPSPEEAHAQAQTIHMRTKFFPFWLMVTEIGHQPELDGRTVVDKTGLDESANYDCELSWSKAGSEGSGPSFFTALQEQMGLKLEPAKGEVEVLVIDGVERPSEN